MADLFAFDGFVVNPKRAGDIVAPAYDSMSADQRARYAESHKDNYLNVMRTRDDYPSEQQIEISEILNSNKTNLNRLIAEDGFVKIEQKSYFVYRLIFEDHQQTGLVAALPVAELDQGVVLRHEQTRADREELLVEYLEVVGASSSPVALAYRAQPEIDSILEDLCQQSPCLDITSSDGVRQILWQVSDPQVITQLAEIYQSVPVTYLTDGHHRTASASRYVRKLIDNNQAPEKDGVWNHVLVALFPHDQLRILPFHRCVKLSSDSTNFETLLSQINQNFAVTRLSCDPKNPDMPGQSGSFTMVYRDQCFSLTFLNKDNAASDGSIQLDVNILQKYVLKPLFGITEGNSNPYLEYVSGSAGIEGVNEVMEKGFELAFYLYPVSIEEIMRVSDLGDVMPPKSTCFEPKVRSGLFLQLNNA
jgi:uncharacterized protein (DUF1015 family)